MLMVFALSITPKQLLHDVITKHKHYVTYDVNANIGKQKFQCNWHEQPVVSPFIDQPIFLVSIPVIAHFSYTHHFKPGYSSAQRLFSSLRGPPQV
jgi:hypothetical protein